MKQAKTGRTAQQEKHRCSPDRPGCEEWGKEPTTQRAEPCLTTRGRQHRRSGKGWAGSLGSSRSTLEPCVQPRAGQPSVQEGSRRCGLQTPQGSAVGGSHEVTNSRTGSKANQRQAPAAAGRGCVQQTPPPLTLTLCRASPHTLHPHDWTGAGVCPGCPNNGAQPRA